ncbi:MAG: hypothetical protein KAY29_02250 [Brevundimonas sp.]|jgi:hypothetical protein|nr:hypothetical protein [Brevundimonas sp.]MBP8072940.1 hypothetical protein [Brevundimonas sp.]
MTRKKTVAPVVAALMAASAIIVPATPAAANSQIVRCGIATHDYYVAEALYWTYAGTSYNYYFLEAWARAHRTMNVYCNF